MANILLIGSSGTTGNHLKMVLVDGNHTLHTLDRKNCSNQNHRYCLDIQNADKTLDSIPKNVRFDLIISMVGKNSLSDIKRKDQLFSQLAHLMVEIARRHGDAKILTISSSLLSSFQSKVPWWMTIVKNWILDTMIEDMLEMVQIIQESGIDYCILRSPYLCNGSHSNTRPTISVEDLGDFKAIITWKSLVQTILSQLTTNQPKQILTIQ